MDQNEYEKGRLAALDRLHISKQPEDEFDLLTKVAAELCGAPYAFITIVDKDSAWTKSAYGYKNQVTKRDEDICHLTIQEELGLSISDLTKYEPTKNLPILQDPSPFRCYLGANLITTEGYRIGSLCILDSVPRDLPQTTLTLLSRLAKQVMALFELKHKTDSLALAYQKMEHLATYDALTGVYVRRFFLEQFWNLKLSLNVGEHLLLAFIDIDHFKKINDSFGHDVGDLVLSTFGRYLLESQSERNLVGRFGGEEFCLVSKGNDVADLKEKLQKFHSGIPKVTIPNQSISITASIGALLCSSEDHLNCDEMIKIADTAVYSAKNNGRNQIVFATI